MDTPMKTWTTTAPRLLLALAFAAAASPAARAAEPLRVYGPGGPSPAVEQAAEAFGRTHGIEVAVTAGPTPKWLADAERDADVVFSGSETMMTDFVAALGDRIDPATVRPLYLRPAAILVRPGNPSGIKGFVDLLAPGHRVLVVNGAGQNGLWEDVAGRLGSIDTVAAFRRNIARFASNSAEARRAWIDDPSLDAWLIWNIWQVANPDLAQVVPIEPEYRIHRDTAVALTRRGARRPEAEAFVDYLASPEGAAIFARWGWTTGGGNPR